MLLVCSDNSVTGAGALSFTSGSPSAWWIGNASLLLRAYERHRLRQLWSHFGTGQVERFALRNISHCQLCFFDYEQQPPIRDRCVCDAISGLHAVCLSSSHTSPVIGGQSLQRKTYGGSRRHTSAPTDMVCRLNIAGKWGSVGSADMQRPVDSSRRNILVSSPWELEAERGLLKVYPGQRCPSICLSGGCSWSSVLHRTRTHLHVLLKRFWRFLIKAILLLWCSVTDSTLSHSGIGCSFSGMHAEKGRISWGDILSSPSVKYGYTRNPTFYIISTSQWGYCRFIGGGK